MCDITSHITCASHIHANIAHANIAHIHMCNIYMFAKEPYKRDDIFTHMCDAHVI